MTGIAVPAVLRASHTKPWAECNSDEQRLNVYNGFLLSANLDALFDRFLVSFDEQGVLAIAPALQNLDLDPLGTMPETSCAGLTRPTSLTSNSTVQATAFVFTGRMTLIRRRQKARS